MMMLRAGQRLILTLLALIVGSCVVAAPQPAWLMAQPCPQVVPLTVPSGWSLVSWGVGTWLLGSGPGVPVYSWDGMAYAVTLPYHGPTGNLPPPGGLGTGLWVYLDHGEDVCVGGHDVNVSRLVPGQLALVGNDTSSPLRAAGADALWVYDQAADYRLVDTLQPGQGAWVHSVAGGTLELTPTNDVQ